MNTYIDPNRLHPYHRTVGACRRLRALAWNGHDPRVVAVRYHIDPALTRALVENGTGGRRNHPPAVSPEEWAAIALAFDDLEMRFGDAVECRARAITCQWAPPLAWDPETIDNPNTKPNRQGHGPDGRIGPATPDMAAVMRRISGERSITLRPVEKTAAIELLYEAGLTDSQIADRAGTAQRSVERWRADRGHTANTADVVVAGKYPRWRPANGYGRERWGKAA